MTDPKLELLTPQNCQLIFIDHCSKRVHRFAAEL